MDDIKWYFIAIAVIFGLMAIGQAVSSYSESQCRMEYAKTSRSVEEIEKICK